MNPTRPTDRDIECLALEIFFCAVEEQACFENTRSRIAWKIRREDALRRAYEMAAQFGTAHRGWSVMMGEAIGFRVETASPLKTIHLVLSEV